MVQNWLGHGAKPQWKNGPPRPFNHGVSLRRGDLVGNQAEFLAHETERAVSVGAWEDAVSDKYVSKCFLVPKPGGKWRLVMDFRWLNSHCIEKSCRFETLKTLSRLAKKGDWMFSFDLQDGYHTIGIAPEDRKYFTFNLNGRLLQASALPFGRNASPYIFVKTMKILVQALRSPTAHTESEMLKAMNSSRSSSELGNPFPHLSQSGGKRSRKVRGLKVLPYMDDFLVMCRTRDEALKARVRVQQVLELLGLQRNEKKGHWDVTQRLEHLGMLVDSKRGLFQVTPARMMKIRKQAVEMTCLAKRQGRLVTARQLARFTGLAQCVYLAVPPARHYLREMHECLKTKTTWGSRVRLSKLALRDLQWWIDMPVKWNGRAIWRSPTTATLHSDACLRGWGGVLNNTTPARGFWNHHERKCHITELELQAVHNVVQSFLPHLRDRHVFLHEDNMAVVHMLVHYTSKSPSIMRRLRHLWLLLDLHNITLKAEYIRSEANVWADALSRELDTEDWRLNPEVFAELDRDFGPHTIDRFASVTSAQLPRYNSRWRDPFTEGVDSLSLDWRGENNYVNPPWTLLPQLAQKLVENPVPCTIVCPFWTGAPWYQQLRDLASEVRVYPPRYNFFLPSRLGASAPVGPAGWSTAVLRVD